MTETNILDESAVSEIEDRAGDKWTVNTDTIRALCATVKHLRAESFRYKTGFDDYVRKLETDNERLTTGLVNLYRVITNQQCERKVALGMATSAVSSLQSELKTVKEDLKYRCEALEELRRCRDRWLTMLNPASADETVDGAIRNLQQAYISERDNAIELQSQLEQLRAENDELARIIVTHGDTIVKQAERLAQVEQERNELRQEVEGLRYQRMFTDSHIGDD